MRHIAPLALALTLLCAVGARAQPDGPPAFHNDFAALFSAHADKVAQGEPNRRVLELPGPVILTETRNRDGSLSYVGMDQSGYGAAGCSFRILAELTVLGHVCPDLTSDAEQATLETSLRRMARFVGANGFPVLSSADADARLRQMVADRAAQFRAQRPTVCLADHANRRAELLTMIKAVTAPAGQNVLKKSMAHPRLPVTNPCL